MADRAVALLQWLISIPDALVYLSLGVASALENILPPIPADLMVVIGGVIAGAGGVDPFILFLAVWIGNVGSALAVYWLGRRHGERFFSSRFGRALLAPRQISALNAAYQRYGFPIIFVSRFLPVFRPVVPVFAGLTKLGFWRTALPIATASAIWYGLVVYVGTIAGSNLQRVLGYLAEAGAWLWGIAGTLILVVAVLWWRTHGDKPGTGAGL
jgi:membrane protein DedA with SNARE-associated domain